MRSPLSPSRTALKSPPPTLPLPSSFCQRLPHPLHQSPPGTSASSLNNPAASEPLSCFTQRNAHTRSCVLVSIFTSLSIHLFPPSPLTPRPLLLFFLLLGDGESTNHPPQSPKHSHTHTRGPSGYPRGR